MLPAKPLPDKVLTLLPRLANDNDAEVVAAARALNRQLRWAGWDLHDVVEYLRSRSPQWVLGHDSQPCDEPADWCDLANWWGFIEIGRLMPREARFMTAMSRKLVQGGEPSPKQPEWLWAIFAKLKEISYGC